MDKVQKGVSMAKAEAFNQIVKLLNINDYDDKVFKEISKVVKLTLNTIEKIKEKYVSKIK